jgi:hypothetical protein
MNQTNWMSRTPILATTVLTLALWVTTAHTACLDDGPQRGPNGIVYAEPPVWVTNAPWRLQALHFWG